MGQKGRGKCLFISKTFYQIKYVFILRYNVLFGFCLWMFILFSYNLWMLIIFHYKCRWRQDCWRCTSITWLVSPTGGESIPWVVGPREISALCPTLQRDSQVSHQLSHKTLCSDNEINIQSNRCLLFMYQ